jgi:hypothetical protein
MRDRPPYPHGSGTAGVIDRLTPVAVVEQPSCSQALHTKQSSTQLAVTSVEQTALPHAVASQFTDWWRDRCCMVRAILYGDTCPWENRGKMIWRMKLKKFWDEHHPQRMSHEVVWDSTSVCSGMPVPIQPCLLLINFRMKDPISHMWANFHLQGRNSAQRETGVQQVARHLQNIGSHTEWYP